MKSVSDSQKRRGFIHALNLFFIKPMYRGSFAHTELKSP